MSTRQWEADEILAAFALYCRTPFGRLHGRNPDIVALAASLGRSPSAVAMKLCNLASLDPTQMARGIRGLANASRGDRELWDAFQRDPEATAYASQRAFSRLSSGDRPALQSGPDGPAETVQTETTAEVRVRLVQRFFRDAVLTSYDSRCGVCEIAVMDLLNASHIIPWRVSAPRRADPTNGISLCVLHDRAFDRGLITFDESLCAVVSPRLLSVPPSPIVQVAFVEAQGRPIHHPHRFAPDPAALDYHRTHIFR